MVKTRSAGDYIFKIVNGVLLTLISIICLYPMLYVLFASISDPMQLMQYTGIIWKPLGFSLEGYKVVLQNPNVLTGYANTLFYVLVGTALNMILTTMGAYGLSRKGYMLKKFFTVAIVFTMYFSGGLIPNFLLVKNLGMYDSRLAVIIPGAIATWNLIVMRTAFASVPASLEESARIDGASDWTILWRVIVPVSKATMAVILLFYSVTHWNSWFNASIYLLDRDKYPLQLFLREILIANTTGGNVAADASSDTTFFLEEVIRYATIIVATVPILCVYPFVQKYFVKGAMMGSLKE